MEGAHHRPGLRTLAINSLFLSSPSTVMTFPFPSTSVQRSLGSRAALEAKDLRWKMDPDSSSSRTLISPSLSGSPCFCGSGPKSHSCHLNLLPSSLSPGPELEANRGAPAAGMSSRLFAGTPSAAPRCFVFNAFGRIALRLKNEAWRAGPWRATLRLSVFPDGRVLAPGQAQT